MEKYCQDKAKCCVLGVNASAYCAGRASSRSPKRIMVEKKPIPYYAYCAEGAFFFTYIFYCYHGVIIYEKRIKRIMVTKSHS
jgi:hypothetical protein